MDQARWTRIQAAIITPEVEDALHRQSIGQATEEDRKILNEADYYIEKSVRGWQTNDPNDVFAQPPETPTPAATPEPPSPTPPSPTPTGTPTAAELGAPSTPTGVDPTAPTPKPWEYDTSPLLPPWPPERSGQSRHVSLAPQRHIGRGWHLQHGTVGATRSHTPLGRSRCPRHAAVADHPAPHQSRAADN